MFAIAPGNKLQESFALRSLFPSKQLKTPSLKSNCVACKCVICIICWWFIHSHITTNKTKTLSLIRSGGTCTLCTAIIIWWWKGPLQSTTAHDLRKIQQHEKYQIDLNSICTHCWFVSEGFGDSTLRKQAMRSCKHTSNTNCAKHVHMFFISTAIAPTIDVMQHSRMRI